MGKTVSSITIRYSDGTVATLVGDEAEMWKRYVNQCMAVADGETGPQPDVDWNIEEEGKP